MLSHVLECATAVAALVAILDYFGIKPKEPRWGGMPLTRNWKLVIMLLLVAASLGMSIYGFYRDYQPKIVEKIVEKPVDRVVEKTVPAQCPKVDCPKSPASNSSSSSRKISQTLVHNQGQITGGTISGNTQIAGTDAPHQEVATWEKV